ELWRRREVARPSLAYAAHAAAPAVPVPAQLPPPWPGNGYAPVPGQVNPASAPPYPAGATTPYPAPATPYPAYNPYQS
ncbi:PrsW family intramembrane metalloprotease, partial [Streptomyces mirabilis]